MQSLFPRPQTPLFSPNDLIAGLDRFQAMLDAVLGVGGTKVAHVDKRSAFLSGVRLQSQRLVTRSSSPRVFRLIR